MSGVLVCGLAPRETGPLSAHRPALRDRAGDQRPRRRGALGDARRERPAPILADLEAWLRGHRDRVSRKSEIGKAIDYTLRRWAALTRFMADGRICLSNNAAERVLRGIALGRRNWTFAGSDRGGERAAAMYVAIAGVTLAYRSCSGSGETLPVTELPQRTHIHGIGVDRDDPARLYLATHHGLFVASPDGTATRISEDQNDYILDWPASWGSATLLSWDLSPDTCPN